MSIFLRQTRSLKQKKGPTRIALPEKIKVITTLCPGDAFGIKCQEIRSTIPLGKKVKVLWDANEGTTVTKAEYIGKILAKMSKKGLAIAVDGNIVTICSEVMQKEEIEPLLRMANETLPSVLSLFLKTFVWIKECKVEIGEAVFHYEISATKHSINVTTRDRQESIIGGAMPLLIGSGKEIGLLLNALHYFKQAERLNCVEPDRVTMTSEVLLNLAKSAEMLFTSNRDKARARASEWGIADKVVETRLIPLLLIRNQIDVAHASASPLTEDERSLVVEFMDHALASLGKILKDLIEKANAGEIVIPEPSKTVDPDKRRLLRAMSKYIGK